MQVPLCTRSIHLTRKEASCLLEVGGRTVAIPPHTLRAHPHSPPQASLPLGRPVLLEGIGECLDASLEPVLLKMTFKQVCLDVGSVHLYNVPKEPHTC